MSVIKTWLLERGMGEELASVLGAVGAAVVVLFLAGAVTLIARLVLLRIISRIVARSQTSWDNLVEQRGFFSRLTHLVPATVIHAAAPTAFQDFPLLIDLAETLAIIYMIVVVVAVVDSLLSAGLDIYQTFEISRRVHLRSFVQVVKILLSFVAFVLVISELLGQSPVIMVSGLGAFSAVILLIFKDPILGFVAGIQLMSLNMVRKGDWIEMPKFGVDGDVLDVNLTTVKVQNWDKTISTVPTYALVSDSFRNWRGMSESGGRRIKRSVYIDMSSIKFCDQEMLDRFRRFDYISEYVEKKLEEVSRHNEQHVVDDTFLINGRHLTNVGTFRAYLEAYLRNHPKIHQDLTFLIRQLAPGPDGLPIEIYVFSNDQVWANYERIQADIFDHVLAVIPLFDLRVFQSPSGMDVRELSGAGAVTDSAERP